MRPQSFSLHFKTDGTPESKLGTTETPLQGLPAGWKRIDLVGPDSKSFLERLSTITPTTRETLGGFFLNPQGKIQASFQLSSPEKDRWSLEYDPGNNGLWDQQLQTFIEKYHFGEDMEIQPRTDLECIWNDTADSASAFDSKMFPLGLSRQWTAPGSNDPSEGSPHLERWLEGRIDRLIPWPGFEISTELNPLDLGCSDSLPPKGCYPGQEVMEKIQAKGRAAKALIQVEGGKPSSDRFELTHQGSACGTLTSWLQTGESTRGLAVVRRSAAKLGAQLVDPLGGTWKITRLDTGRKDRR